MARPKKLVCTVTLSFPKELFDWLRDCAKANDMGTGQFVRALLQERMETADEAPPPAAAQHPRSAPNVNYDPGREEDERVKRVRKNSRRLPIEYKDLHGGRLGNVLRPHMR